MEKYFKAVLFDMDGLLIDTENYWGSSMLQVAHHYGSPVTAQQLKETTGLRIYEVTEYWQQHYPWQAPISAYDMAEEIIDNIIAQSKQHCVVMPGVIELLQKLQSTNIKIGLATSSTERMMQGLVRHFNLDQYFETLSSADSTGMGKPNPSVFIHAANALEVNATKCIVLEDSVNGMIAGLSARMRTIVVPAAHDLNKPAFAAAYAIIPSLEQWQEQWLYR